MMSRPCEASLAGASERLAKNRAKLERLDLPRAEWHPEALTETCALRVRSDFGIESAAVRFLGAGLRCSAARSAGGLYSPRATPRPVDVLARRCVFRFH